MDLYMDEYHSIIEMNDEIIATTIRKHDDVYPYIFVWCDTPPTGYECPQEEILSSYWKQEKHDIDPPLLAYYNRTRTKILSYNFIY